jgi:hypothetical protein
MAVEASAAAGWEELPHAVASARVVTAMATSAAVRDDPGWAGLRPAVGFIWCRLLNSGALVLDRFVDG